MLGVATVGLVGCRARGETIADDELRRAGQWTARDALARRLLDLDAPEAARGLRPVRLTPLSRKVVAVVNGVPLPRAGRAAEVLLGLDYEVKYHYVAKVRAYVLLHRDRPPTVMAEETGAAVTLPGDDTPEAVFSELRRSLERDMEAVLQAAGAKATVEHPGPIEP